MVKDDEAARKAKAERLRKQIARYTQPEPDEAESSADEPESSQVEDAEEDSQERPARAMSPREFVHKRMRELDEEEEK